MTKKSLNKLLSVILTLAICSAAVFGCLITANAEDVTCYEWSEGVVAEDLKSATINLTLTAPSSVLPDGMAEAELGFTADADLVLNSVEVTDGVPTSGAFNAADFEEVSQNENGKYLIDVKTADKCYTSVVLKLTFGFTGGTAASGAKYNVRVTANSLTMFDAHDNSFNYTGTGTVGVIKTGCDHIYDITGATLVTTNTVEGYRVYKDVACKNCGVVNPYQVVPATELKSVIYWDGATQTEPTAQDADGNYIISTAEELAYIAGQTDAAATSGKSYKIADGIGAIVLQKQADVDGEKLMGLADYAQTKAYFDALASKTVWVAGDSTVFAGTLDGNGAEIYGIYTDGTKNSVGLFGSVAQGVTIKNLAVKNSYVAGLARVGALFGGVTSTDNGTVTVEKVIISGCYVEGNATGNSLYTAGVMAGSTYLDNKSPKVGLTYRNCLVYSNHSVFSQDKRIVSSIVGMFHAGFNQSEETTYGCNNQFENSIILDCVPYSLLAGQNNSMFPDNFANIYTNAVDYDNTATWPAVISVAKWFTWANFDGKIISVHRDDAKGDNAKTNCANLAWDTVWFADPNGGYPTFEGEILGQKSVVYLTASNKEPDSTFTDGTHGSGTEVDPYIISTPGQLRQIVQNSTTETTTGKFYKIDPTIGMMVLQYESYITAVAGSLDAFLALDAEGTKTALSTETNRQQWQSGSTASDYDGFAGNIDFSGVTICGMYNANGGLFAVARGATFKNLILSNNYITSTWYNGNLVGMVRNASGAAQETLTVDSVVVKNCYQSTTGNGYINTGVLIGTTMNSYNIAHRITNILTYGNVSLGQTSSSDTSMSNCALYGALSTTWNGYGTDFENAYFEDIVTLDCVPYPTAGVNNQTTRKEYWHDSIYTTHYDSAYKPNSWAEISAITAIKQISASQLKGADAVTAMPDLDWNVWSYDGNGGYPTPVAQAISTNSQYILNLKAANIAYNTDGTFNFNFYYEPTVAGVTPVLYVGQANGSGFNKLTGTALTAEEIAATPAYQDAGLAAGTIRYTIKNISAREIDDTLLPTAVAKNGATTVWGKTEQISVADYAKALIASEEASVTDGDKQVAAALVNYGTAAATALATAAPGASDKTVVYLTASNKEPDSTFMDGTHGSGTEADPYIISTPGQLRYIVQKSTTETTTGLYYKVDPTIGMMVLQYESYIKAVAGSLDAFLKLDAEGTKAALSTTADRQQWQSGSSAANYDGFAGNIDFSGVTICGMYNGNGGLFGLTRGATIKNLCLSNNYLTSGWGNGNVVGMVYYPGNTADNYLKLTLNNIVVKNCYQYTTGSGYANTGVLLGTTQSAKYVRLDVRNILTYGNISKGTTSSTDTTENDCALFGNFQTSWNGDSNVDQLGDDDNAYFEDIVTLDCVPYPTQTTYNQMTRAKYWHDSIYTTHYDSANKPNSWAELSAITAIKQINASDAVGGAAVTAMPDLDWSSTWTMGIRNDYPSPIPTGVVLETVGKTIYWSGDTDSTLADNGETGDTAEDPIIIDSAEELAYLVSSSKLDRSDTLNKYYKIADGIDKIVLQPSSNSAILGLTDAAAVKAYFSDTSGKTLKEWKNTGWNGTAFAGTFDGNGVTIYGMYGVTANKEQGLFPEVDAGAVLKNFTLKNSYLTTTSTNYDSAFISSRSIQISYGAKINGVITYEGISVINNYMRRAVDNHSRIGLFTGEFDDVALVKNCLAYGNDATYTLSDVEYNVALLGTARNDNTYTEDMPEDIIVNGGYACYTVKNSIILGAAPYNIYYAGNRRSYPNCYSNVYSDTMPTLNGQTFTDAQVKLVNAADLIGAGGKATVDALNTANGGATVWYTGNPFDGYPSLEPAGSMPTAYQSAYDAVDFTSYNSYTGSNDQFGVYTTSLNLKNNPYLSIVFAFGKEGDVSYKENRANINVTVTGASGTIYSGNVPAYVEGEYISGVNGWTNKKNAGRFHTLKLDAPVYDLVGELTVTINYNSGEKVVTNKVSVSGFGNELLSSYKKNPSDYYVNCAEAVKALLFYTQSVKQVYGSK